MEPGALSVAIQRDVSGWAREHLAGDVVGWLTTVAADGTPQSSVISFLWEAETIFFYSKPATPKLRNIARSRWCRSTSSPIHTVTTCSSSK